MEDENNFYAILGVKETATEDEIKTAWIKKLRTCSPNMWNTIANKEEKNRIMDLYFSYKDAYETLINDKKRANFNRFGRVIDVSEIIPGLWLGAFTAAVDHEFLKQHKISHVLSVLETPPTVPDNITHRYMYIVDALHGSLLPLLPEAFEFIETGLKNGTGVLVHCMAGVSRSASVVIGYLMKSEKKSWIEVSQFVRTRRDVISPGMGFELQIKHFEKMNYQITGQTPEHQEYHEKYTISGKFDPVLFWKEKYASSQYKEYI